MAKELVDKNGAPLKVGDKVFIEGTVDFVNPDADNPYVRVLADHKDHLGEIGSFSPIPSTCLIKKA